MYEDKEYSFEFRHVDEYAPNNEVFMRWDYRADAATWPELVLNFYDFLKGCGYIMSKRAFLETFADDMGQYDDAVSDAPYVDVCKDEECKHEDN